MDTPTGERGEARPPSRPGTPDEFKMSLMEHLGELRTRLLRVTVAVLVLGVAGLVFAREIYGLLMQPVLKALPPESTALVYTSAIEEINVLMKIGLYAGIFLATPVLLWQVWQFVSPGLYANERRYASPFIVFGTIAFLVGATFCYKAVLPSMFEFLLQNETAQAIRTRLDTSRLREQDVLRYLRLGDAQRAAAHARAANDELEASGSGQTKEGRLGFTLSLLPKPQVDVQARLEGMGRLIDAARLGYGEAAQPVLLAVMEKRVAAVDAYAERNFEKADALLDEAAVLLGGVEAGRAEDFGAVWKLERLLGVGNAAYESENWTRPMLSMSEQLTLVLVLELAFGVIFELPLVMALLGLVGVVSSAFLFKYQRHAFVVCLIAAAIITPTGDAVNLSLMAGPMLLCYELGVLLVWLVEKRRARQPTALTPRQP